MNRRTPELNQILEIIGSVAENTADGDFVYRGEPQHYEYISSSLWRECRHELGAETFDIEAIQTQMLEEAKGYTPTEDAFEILTELQHYGGHTNLIDFTTDTHIALFFACDGFPDTSGRLVLFRRSEAIDERYRIRFPQHPRNRVIGQKSIFVRPPKGFLEPEHYEVIDIPASLKGPLAVYLRNQHGISTQTVYNDLHGFIRYRDDHLKSSIEAHQAETRPDEDTSVADMFNGDSTTEK